MSGQKITAFSELLSHYGFKTEEEKRDFILLLYLSGSFDEKSLYADLAEVNFSKDEISQVLKKAQEAIQGYKKQKNINVFSSSIILNELFSFPLHSTCSRKIHQWLLRVTQRNFFSRLAGQERWEQSTSQWIRDYEEQIKIIISRMEIKNEKLPELSQYTAVVVFGSTSEDMEKRLLYIKKLIDERAIYTDRFYFLCGERPATKNIDGSIAYLEQVARSQGILFEDITETHLMKYIYEMVKGDSNFSTIPAVFIDTPKQGKNRPTTVDTLTELVNIAPVLNGNILFVSSAPHIEAQKEEAIFILNYKNNLPEINIEVVGPACENIPLNEIINAIGDVLYAGYPRVAVEMGYTSELSILEAERSKLSYTRQKMGEA